MISLNFGLDSLFSFYKAILKSI